MHIKQPAPTPIRFLHLFTLDITCVLPQSIERALLDRERREQLEPSTETDRISSPHSWWSRPSDAGGHVCRGDNDDGAVRVRHQHVDGVCAACLCRLSSSCMPLPASCYSVREVKRSVPSGTVGHSARTWRACR